MKQREVKALDISVNLNVPATAEELNTSTRENACYDLAIDYYTWHVGLPRLRREFTAALEKETEIKRLSFTEGEGDSARSKTETDDQYFRRVLKETGKMPSDFQPLMQKVANEMPFELAKPRTGGGGGKLADRWVKAAERKIADGKARKLAKKLGVKLPEGDSEEAKAETVQVLGKAIKEFTLRQQKAAEEAAMAEVDI